MLIHRRTNVSDLNFHLVLVTKYRKKVFATTELRKDMEDMLRRIAANNEVIIQSMEVMDDHVHLLVTFHPNKAISDIVKSFKGTAAREWFKKHPETKRLVYKGHLWTKSYFVSTVGNVSKKVVQQYIENQMSKAYSDDS